MVILTRWRGQSLTLSTKPNCLTLSLQSGKETRVFSFDGEGRFWTGMVENISYRRGLDGKIVAKWQEEGNLRRERRWLSQEESTVLQENAREICAVLLNDIQSGQLTLNPALDERGWSFLKRAAEFTPDRYRQDVARYHAVYRPVGILPPDQYMAVVLQAAEGCSFNTCTFCNFYRDRPFRIKKTDEFREHMKAVREFLGEGLSLRRTIFLGDANALVIPMPKLVALMEAVHEQFDVERLGGIYAFLDGFSAEKKTPSDYARLRELGLRRVYIGMESGNDALLRFLKKPGTAEDVVQAVQAIKRGGVAVGIILLLGAGGHQFAQQHVADSIRALQAMSLDADDLIYFSELVEGEGMEYTRDAFQAHLHPLSPEERIAQGEAIERALSFSEEGGTPHISRYDIREFVY